MSEPPIDSLVVKACAGDNLILGSDTLFSDTTITFIQANPSKVCDSIFVYEISFNEIEASFTYTQSPTDSSLISFTNSSPLGFTYSWQFGDGNSSSAFEPTHKYTIPGVYNVQLNVSDSTGCEVSVFDEVKIPSNFMLEVPNIFTPNGDGINDVFTIGNLSFGDQETFVEVNIYNRWGDLVFQSNNFNFKWNGANSGQQSAEGVYFWVITTREGEVIKGFVTLSR